MSRLDRELLDRLAALHGDAFYLLDLPRFESNCASFRDELRRSYPASNFAYSYKTNYLPVLCRAVHKMGGYAEVVSAMEYDLARDLAVPAERIIFNGPYKPAEILERSLLEGATVNVDSCGEARLVESIALRHGDRSLRIGLRCNLDVGSGEVSRFGLDAGSDGFVESLERLRRLDNCRVEGLHCHFCTPDKSVAMFLEAARQMIDLARRHFTETPPRFINVGGGFFSPMPQTLRGEFACDVPSFREYADAIAPQFAANYSSVSGPELIIEPGISVAADVMRFVARVVEIKTVRSRTLAVVTGSVYNVKPTKSRVNLPMSVVSAPPAASAEAAAAPLDIVGYTCMEDDCLFAGWRRGLSVGDYVVFDNVGAYTIVLKPPFIFPCPPILALEPGSNEHRTVKRAETPADLFSTHVLE